MGILRREKKEDKDKEYGQAMALTDTQRPATGPEYIDALGRMYYMIKDDQVAQLLWQTTRTRKLRNLIPAFSALNRLSNIDEKEARILKLRYKILLLKQKISMDEDTYETSGGGTLLNSLEIFSRSMIHDAFHGWKGKTITEQTKVFRTEVTKEKKRRF